MSALDEIRKKRELEEIRKKGGSQLDVAKKQISQNRKEIAETGKIDYGVNLSPVKSTKTTTKKDSGWLSAFDDGYDFGDISKTILKGGGSLLKTGYNAGKEFVTHPIQTTKTLGVGLASGTSNAIDFINGAAADFVDWVAPDSLQEKWAKRESGPSLKEFNSIAKNGTTEERQKLSQQLKSIGQDKMAESILIEPKKDGFLAGVDKAINTKFYETDTYKKKQEGKLSKGQETIWGVGENVGAMLPSVGASIVAGPAAGTALFYAQSQQSYTEQAKARGYTDKEARKYGLIMGGAEVIVERLGFDELGGLSKLSQQSLKKAMVGEGLEEFVMPYIDSTVKSVGFDEEFDFQGTTKEAFEGAVMGAVVGGIMSAGGRGLAKVDRFIEKVNNGEEITQNDIVEAGRELEQNDPSVLQEAMSEVPKVVQEQTTQQPTETVEKLEKEIVELDSQLNENLSDEQYEAIQEQIRIRENKIEQIENGTTQVEQNVQPITQEVETKSLVDASSNTLNNVNTQQNEEIDNMGRKIPENYREELKDSKARDEKGQLKELYHGTTKAGFDKIDGHLFLTDNIDIAKDYAGSDIVYDANNPNANKTPNLSRDGKEMYWKPSQEIINNIEEYTLSDLNSMFDAVDSNNSMYDVISDFDMNTPIKELRGSLDKRQNLIVDEVLESLRDEVISERDKLPIPLYNGEKANNFAKSEQNKKIYKGYANLKNPLVIDKNGGKVTQNEIKEAKQNGYDGIIATNTGEGRGNKKGTTYIVFDPEGYKNISQKTNDNKTPTKSETTSNVQEVLSPINEAVKDLKQVQKEVIEQVEDLKETMDEFKALTKEQYQGLQEQLDEANKQEQTPPPEVEVTNDKLDTSALDDRTVNKITKDFARGMKLNKTQKTELNNAIKEISSRGNATVDDVLDVLYNYDEMSVRQRNEEIAEAKGHLRNISSLKISPSIASDVDMTKLRPLAKNNLKFKVDDAGNVDMYYDELSEAYPHLFPSDVITPSQQFEIMVDVASTPIYSYESLKVPHGTLTEEAQYMYDLMEDYKIDQKTKDSDKDYKSWVKSLRGLEPTPEVNEVSPVKEETKPNKEEFRKAVIESAKEVEKELGYMPKDPRKAESYEYDEEIAEVLTSEPKTPKEQKNKVWAWIKANIFDKGMVFEDLAIKTKNRKLQAKWDFSLTSESRAQYIIGNGHVDENGNQTSKSLNDIMAEVNNTGLTKEFYEYMYHNLNVDRMTLANRFEGAVNKAVFGDSITAEMSKRKVNEYEMAHPEFIDFAQDVYDYVNADREQLVKEGVISQETADLWQQMYPHYVPIRRAGHEGAAINVALDTNRTGVNAPIKKATGGNSDILPLFDTMAQRTIQTQRATAKNSFGIELKNTLKAKGIKNTTSVDEVIDSVDNQEGLLQEGKNGANPTFTVFQNGERVTYEITEEMYEALKPISDSSILSKTIKPLNTASNIHRGLLTQYNIFFALKNGIKDVQDVLINSQHAAKTYAKVPEAYAQLLGKGHWYNEYMRNGGEQNSYFDSQEMNFDTKNKGLAKVLDLPPLKQIAQLNDFIERVPRLAEYIASRESGKSIEESMLDAARVTTNFKAGGNVTKFANRNGATFLNASIQGAMQQVRNVREANMNGFKGWANLATKFAVAGVPAMILNSLLWDDDEEYEELSDYVKQNYYIVGKYGDGQFIRIPKGRTVAVIQDGIEQISNAATGNDEVDLASFLELVTTNLAPTNPLENNIFAPMIQAATNKTWYGDDLVPSRLQDLPAAEQFDETTDSFSRWLGEKTNISPVKINYLLNQYSGVVGDIVMPMITPKATQGEGSPLLAPLKDIFTVDGVMKNQNVSDFYETSEKLTTGAKSKNATDEDILKNKYINSVKTELNDLYKEKREIQSDESLSKGEKYKQAKEIQKQINAITKDALSKYSDGQYTDNYGIIDDKEYYINTKGDWTAVREKEQAALNEMGMTLEEKSTYFEGKNEISRIVNDYKEDKDDLNDTYEDEELKERIDTLSSEKKRNIIKTIQNTGLSDEKQAYLYKKYYSTDTIDNVLSANIGVSNYFDYVQQEFTADYNSKGNAIPNSRKNKVIEYVNEYDLTIAQKAILIKSTNTFKFNEYNNEIVEYVGGLDIGYEEKVRILKDLKMKVHADGSVTWED